MYFTHTDTTLCCILFLVEQLGQIEHVFSNKMGMLDIWEIWDEKIVYQASHLGKAALITGAELLGYQF